MFVGAVFVISVVLLSCIVDGCIPISMSTLWVKKKQWRQTLVCIFSVWFSKSFHRQTRQTVCNKMITKVPTTPERRRYTPLWNVNAVNWSVSGEDMDRSSVPCFFDSWCIFISVFIYLLGSARDRSWRRALKTFWDTVAMSLQPTAHHIKLDHHHHHQHRVIGGAQSRCRLTAAGS